MVLDIAEVAGWLAEWPQRRVSFPTCGQQLLPSDADRRDAAVLYVAFYQLARLGCIQIAHSRPPSVVLCDRDGLRQLACDASVQIEDWLPGECGECDAGSVASVLSQLP